MAENNGANRLLDEAIDLLIRLQDDRSNPVTQATINRWRARSSRHEEIWQKLSGTHNVSGQVLKEKNKAARKADGKVTRRKLIIGGLAGLGASTAGTLLLPDILLSARADHITAKGELSRLTLIEGTKSVLGPDTAIALDFAASRRQIELLKGMAYFDVPKSTEQPLTVRAGHLSATAAQSVFEISEDAGFVNISVGAGVVEARDHTHTDQAAQILEAGQWLRFDAASPVAYTRGLAEPQHTAAWRDGMIIADQEPVAVLVAKIGRWIPGRIVVLDPNVAQQRVSGLFDLSDPHRALEAIVHPAGAQVRFLSRYLTVISPI